MNNNQTNNNYIKVNFNTLLNNNEVKPENTVKKSNRIIKYTITVIENTEVNNYSLNNFNKNIITFGRKKDNDIVLSSILTSLNHGYFELNKDLVLYDNNSKNGLYINGKKVTKAILKDGDAIRIDNPYDPLNSGVMMIVTIGESENSWLQYDLTNKTKTIIGRGKDCDIALNKLSIYF